MTTKIFAALALGATLAGSLLPGTAFADDDRGKKGSRGKSGHSQGDGDRSRNNGWSRSGPARKDDGWSRSNDWNRQSDWQRAQEQRRREEEWRRQQDAQWQRSQDWNRNSGNWNGGWADREADRRQQTKNEWRNLAIASGAVAILGLIQKDQTLFFAGTAGALYSAYRYEQDRKSQNSLNRARAYFFSQPYFYRDGNRYDRRVVYRGGQKYYQFCRS